MYCHHESVNILTSLLVAHGIRHAVVCPGSRNAAITHNLSECADISCYGVTDERSAAFFALGIAQATHQPVAVCVTSGTALLNVMPAVAEAYYQQQSLIIISADRPQEWIGQLDGQTLQQTGVLAPWVSKTVVLPLLAQHTDSHAWYCNRLVNEALVEATSDLRHCVHINVPLAEPLFSFDVERLPVQRVIRRYPVLAKNVELPQAITDDFMKASRPLVVVGQMPPQMLDADAIGLFRHVPVLHEALAPFAEPCRFDFVTTDDSLFPDFILYIGNVIVSKKLKQFLRCASNARCWRISMTGQVEDTFMNLNGVLTGRPNEVLTAMSACIAQRSPRVESAQSDYHEKWSRLLHEADDRIMKAEPSGGSAAVSMLEQGLQSVSYPYAVHYANSTAVRLANSYARGHYVWCNRGVNGIEGTLSTAVGFAAVTLGAEPQHRCFCVMGDLSFFYDSNALWNRHVSPGLRIMLLNDCHGAIFDTLPGLSASPAAATLVAGKHNTSAEGICRAHGIGYMAAHNDNELRKGVDRLLSADLAQPMLLEIFVES